MTDLQTDEEKVEVLRKWLKDNGVSVIAGLAIGLGAVFGWRAWVDHETQVSQQASIAYEQLLYSVDGGAGDGAGDGAGASAAKQAEKIAQDYSGTAYAMLAELAAAKSAIEAGDTAQAIAALKDAVDRAPEPGLAKIAELRLARVLIASGDRAEAAELVDAQRDHGPFAAEFAALRGDIAAAEGQVDRARSAYLEAIGGGAGNSQLLELKLQDLPAGDAS